MECTLSIYSQELDATGTQALIRELCATLNKETDVSAKFVEKQGKVGQRGGLEELVLTLISSGAVTLLFEVLKTYFERRSSLVMEFEREAGEKLAIRATNVQGDQLDKTIKLANDFFDL
jgi:hypothetical protein